MRGYKVFNPDWTCRGFQFKVGETYTLTNGQAPIACKQGFHFCERAVDCFNYYSFDPRNKVAIVEANGDVVKKDDKCCTDSLTIVEEVSWEKVLTLVNTGIGNSGYRNSGDYNSGYRNSGDYNSGNSNSGNSNSGAYNSGYCNSGDYNHGDYNSGDYNHGDYNSGDYNSGDYNSGFLNSTTPETVRVFNKEVIREVWEDAILPDFFYFNLVVFVPADNMTEKEKEDNPNWEFVGGYSKTLSYKEAWQESYRKAPKEDREKVKRLPNFDADVFFEITGIRVD